MSISDGVRKALDTGPMTVAEIAEYMSVPAPHIRAAVTELVFIDRLVTCDKDGCFSLDTPPDSWPKVKGHR